jgi:D-threonate/D-erythronate kinase
MSHLLILADDLTGAADSGAAFARRGWRTLLALEPGTGADADVLVLSTDSRALPEDAAASAVRSALAQVNLSNFLVLYKKIDSTLRGHPAAELGELLGALGETRALIAPAFPAQGRSTRDGHVFVNGVPLEDTAFEVGPAGGNLRQLFGGIASPGLLSLDGVRGGTAGLRAALGAFPGLWIADAETDADLISASGAALGLGWRVLCGSAGLANALAEGLGENPTGGAINEPQAGAARGPLLVVAGSRHAATAAQVRAACRAGARLVTPGADFYAGAGSEGVAEAAQALAEVLGRGETAILAVEKNPPSPPYKGGQKPLYAPSQRGQDSPLPTRTTLSFKGVEGGQNQAGIDPKGFGKPLGSEREEQAALVARKLGETAALAMAAVSPGGLFLTGGDTARAVCRALGCTQLWLGGEVEPGLPWSRLGDGRCADLPVVTKAGGFGNIHSIVKALGFLQRQH